MTAKRVTTWENQEVHGRALCAPQVLDREYDKVAALRQKHAAYLAGLPTKPEDCILASLQVLHEGGNDMPAGLEEALHLSMALRPMIEEMTEGEPGPLRDAALFLATRMQDCLMVAADRIEHVTDILGNPAKVAGRI